MYRQDEFLALPDNVVTFAWSAPMRDLAARIGITDVGLKKLSRGQGSPRRRRATGTVFRPAARCPTRRSRRRAGPARPAASASTGAFAGWSRKRDLPEEGPFASAGVPEDLGQLRAKELKAIGRVNVARSVEHPHPALAALVRREDERRAKQAAGAWSWDGPEWAGPLAQRRLKILDALFRALSQRGHAAWIRVGSGELDIWCRIAAIPLELASGHAGRTRERYGNNQEPRGDQPAAIHSSSSPPSANAGRR